MVLPRHSRRFLATILLGGTLSLAGCKPDAAVKDPGVIGRGSKEPAPPAPDAPAASVAAGSGDTASAPIDASGSIAGTILFNGKPPAGSIDTSQDPACSLGSKPRLPVEQYAAKNGKLANVFVYVKSGPPEAMQQNSNAFTQAVVLDQKNCQYLPHVIGVMQGGFVEFRNSDPTMHNVHVNPTDIGNQTIDISIGPRGQPLSKQFLRPELMIPVRCNNHPWMNAFINVSATPYFAVSDANGHFELRGLPPGNYVIGAVHEIMGQKTMEVRVESHAASKAEFGFTLQ